MFVLNFYFYLFNCLFMILFMICFGDVCVNDILGFWRLFMMFLFMCFNDVCIFNMMFYLFFYDKNNIFSLNKMTKNIKKS